MINGFQKLLHLKIAHRETEFSRVGFFVGVQCLTIFTARYENKDNFELRRLLNTT